MLRQVRVFSHTVTMVMYVPYMVCVCSPYWLVEEGTRPGWLWV